MSRPFCGTTTSAPPQCECAAGDAHRAAVADYAEALAAAEHDAEQWRALHPDVRPLARALTAELHGDPALPLHRAVLRQLHVLLETLSKTGL